MNIWAISNRMFLHVLVITSFRHFLHLVRMLNFWMPSAPLGSGRSEVSYNLRSGFSPQGLESKIARGMPFFGDKQKGDESPSSIGPDPQHTAEAAMSFNIYIILHLHLRSLRCGSKPNLEQSLFRSLQQLVGLSPRVQTIVFDP